MNQKEKEIKSRLRLQINLSLLAVSFTVFALLISIKPTLLEESIFVPIQLTLAIPLLLSSIFARSKLSYTKKPKLWNTYGFITFLVAYSFLINVIGILLANTIGILFGIVFLGFNILTSVAYSIIETIEDKSMIYSRIKKDVFFFTLLLIGGIIPSLGLI